MEYQGSAFLRYRIVTSLIMGVPIRITNIRSKSEYPGLTDAEVKYLELVAKLTSGSEVEINQAGTVLKFSPGIITNNPTNTSLTFACGSERAVGFFIEGILPFVLFGKNKLSLTLTGLSHHSEDIGIDIIQSVQIPIVKKFGIEDIEMKIVSRGETCEVFFKVTPVRKLGTVSLIDPGKVKKVRGVAFTSKMNVQMGNRAAYAAKGQLHSFLPDIWIHTDHYKFGNAILGITLVAESNTGSVVSSEFLRGEGSHCEHLESEVPEDLGCLAVIHLLEEIMYGGFVDSNNQCLVLLLMALAPAQSSIRLGRISSQAVHVLRLIQDVLNVKFEFSEVENTRDALQKAGYEEDQEELAELPKNIIASCVGISYENMARIAF